MQRDEVVFGAPNHNTEHHSGGMATMCTLFCSRPLPITEANICEYRFGCQNFGCYNRPGALMAGWFFFASRIVG